MNDNGLPTSEVILNIINENKLLAFDLFRVTDFEKYAKTLGELFTTLEERWQAFQLTQVKEPSKKLKA